MRKSFSYEKVVSDRPLRCPVDPFAIVPAHPKGPGKTPYPRLAQCSRRHLLRAKKRLPLAATSPRLPSVVYRLLPFQEIPTERAVVPHPQSLARCREEQGGQRSPTNSGHHGFPECQNPRRIGPPEWLRRPQEPQSLFGKGEGETFGVFWHTRRTRLRALFGRNLVETLRKLKKPPRKDGPREAVPRVKGADSAPPSPTLLLTKQALRHFGEYD